MDNESVHVWPGQCSFRYEAVVYHIEDALRYLKVAQSRSAQHIPKLLTFGRSDRAFILKVSTQPLCLRDLVQDRPLVQANAHKIIGLLLSGYYELRKLKMVNKQLEPQSIYLSADLGQMVFACCYGLRAWGQGRRALSVLGTSVAVLLQGLEAHLVRVGLLQSL